MPAVNERGWRIARTLAPHVHGTDLLIPHWPAQQES
jgi:hypothetical protein